MTTPEVKPFPYTVSPDQIALLDDLAMKLKAAREKIPAFALMSMETLYSYCTPEQRELVELVGTLRPELFGIRAPYLGLFEASSDFIEVSGQEYLVNGAPKIYPPVYLPKATSLAYEKLRAACFEETGNQLLICAGYRSPAFQLRTFLSIYRMYNYDISPTVKRVVLPGYSQHGNPSALAVDFLTYEGQPSGSSPLEFRDTPEFEWLMRRGNDFDFYLSYPPHNLEGLMYEPWHWQHRPSGA